MKDKVNKVETDYICSKVKDKRKRKSYCFKKEFGFEDPYIQGHIVDHHFIFPAVLYLKIIDELVEKCLDSKGAFHISNLIFCKKFLTNRDTTVLDTRYMETETYWSFHIMIENDTYCQGRIEKQVDEEYKGKINLDAWESSSCSKKTGEEFYSDLQKKGFNYKKAYKPLQYILNNDQEAFSFLIDSGDSNIGNNRIRPSIIEGGLQSAGFVMQRHEEDTCYLPAEIKNIEVYHSVAKECYVHIRVKPNKGKISKWATIEYYDTTGVLCVKIEDYIMIAVPNQEQKVITDNCDLEETDIAIVGMSGRLGKTKDLDDLWRKIINKIDVIEEVPLERFNIEDYYGDPHREENKTDCIWGCFLEDIDLFDNIFFKISKEEAKYMDPQIRLLLENVWRTLESSSYSSTEISNSKTGIYVGVSNNEYLEVMGNRGNSSSAMLGNNHSMVANKISAVFNLKGPSEPIDTLCSSSLVALVKAMADIRAGMCDQAIVSGVNIILSPRLFITYSDAGMLSKTGCCHTFDQAADGFIRGEGIVSLMLKPIRKAIEDKDHILGVIKGGAIEHQGRSISLTSPLVNSQADTIFHAIRSSHIRPEQVSYIESHGTGTSLGDVVEVNGLKKAFELLGAEEDNYCRIGTIKSQFGHTESAAGIAGVAKVLLAMKNNLIPGNVHINKLNTQLKIEGSPFIIEKENHVWNRKVDAMGIEWPRYAGISSFGAGGVNAHLVIRDFDNMFERVPETNFYIFVLSAQTLEQLKEYAGTMLAFICAHPECFENIIYTLQLHRDVMRARLVCTGKDRNEIIHKLSAYIKGEYPDSVQVVYDKNYNLWSEKSKESHMAELIKSGNFDDIMKHYLDGVSIPWNLMYENKVYSRVQLPGYPFKRKRLWYCEKEFNNILLAKESFHKEELTSATKEKSKSIIFCENDSLASEWIKEMVDEEYVIVLPEVQKTDVRKRYHYLNLKQKKSYDALFKTLINDGDQELELIVTSEAFKAFNEIELISSMQYLICASINARKNIRVSLYYCISNLDHLEIVKHLALEAFFKSYCLENKRFKATMIVLEDRDYKKRLILQEARHVFDSGFQFLRYKNMERSRKVLSEFKFEINKRHHIEQGKTYLITGGTGRIGGLLADYLTQSCGANVIIIGRSKPKEIQKKNITYYSADISDFNALQKVVKMIDKNNTVIHGIIHLAAQIHDSRLEEKTVNMIGEVVSPKIWGLRNLDQLTAQMQLEFFVAFSSITAVIGNIGQCDYAYANQYMSLFMEERNELVKQAKRSGMSVAVNWPEWRDGGMKIPDGIRKSLFRTTGLDAIETKQAIDMLLQAIEQNANNITILSGYNQKIREKFLD